MTMQVTDPFVWNDEEWFFLGAENVYSLFEVAGGKSHDRNQGLCKEKN